MADQDELPQGATASLGQEPPAQGNAQPEELPSPGQDVNSLDWSKLPNYEVPPDLRAAIDDQFRERERSRTGVITRKLQDASKYEAEVQRLRPLAEGFENLSARVAAMQESDPEGYRYLMSRLTGPNGSTSPSSTVPPERVAKGWQKKEDIAEYIENRLQRLVAEQIAPHVQAVQEERMTGRLEATMRALPDDLKGQQQKVLALWKSAPNLTAEQAVAATFGQELARRAAVSATRTESGAGFEEALVPKKKFLRTIDAVRDAAKKHGVNLNQL